ncbi:MAG: PPC domain-containing protein [Armatimonadetes bacterium]|nr:PPC domain-containing protein [Anaerolineae bacterium]
MWIKISSRYAAVVALLISFSIFTVSAPSAAQDIPTNTLVPGQTATGTVNEQTVATVFTFNAFSAGTVSIQVTADEGLTLSVLLTDATGAALAQATDIANSSVVGLTNVALPASGVYYVTVFPAAGTATRLTGSFSVIIDGDAVAAAENVATPAGVDASATPTTQERIFQLGEALTTGISVSLAWQATSDLNLQVRDPIGRTLFFDSRTTDNGGEFGFDLNGLCEVLTNSTETATETANWGAGAVATGSYEVLVYYRQDCENVGEVPFTVNISVGGVALPAITGTVNPPSATTTSVYLASFIINADGTALLGPQGAYTDTRILPEPATVYLEAAAVPLVVDAPTSGLITSDAYYQTFSFSGTANQVVTISMNALDGNLDTLLLLLDQTGRVVADNDDVIDAQNTNSAIQSFLLPADGTYTVLATRYGKDVGGTEGNFQLTLSSATAGIPTELLSLALPTGDIEATLVWNTNADLQLLVRDPVGDAVFDDARDIPSGGRLISTGNINCTVSETTPPAYYIYWPTGRGRGGSYEVEVWYQNDCQDTTPVTATLFLRVAGQLLAQETLSIEAGERYVTSFTIDQSGNPTISEGGIIGGLETIDFTTELATPILYGSDTLGTILPNNKFDVYTFAGVAGDVVTIELLQANGSLDPLLFLVAPDSLEAATNDDAVPGENTNSIIQEFVLPLTGTYTIVATHFGTIFGGTTGGYTLSLRRVTPVLPTPVATTTG